jgi:hypothetical protein
MLIVTHFMQLNAAALTNWNGSPTVIRLSACPTEPYGNTALRWF